MEEDMEMYLSPQARCNNGSNSHHSDPNLPKQTFCERVALAYLKLAYLFVEEIERPMKTMKKIIRKKLKPGKGNSKRGEEQASTRKMRRKSTSTQNQEILECDTLKQTNSTDCFRA